MYGFSCCDSNDIESQCINLNRRFVGIHSANRTQVIMHENKGHGWFWLAFAHVKIGR